MASRYGAWAAEAAASTRLTVVTFGQQSGPPAPARQVQELLTLLRAAGHSDFRDARGPMGFTQRQAAGKFTRDEVAAFIDQLQADELDPSDEQLSGIPAEQLAAELRRRGWRVAEP